MSFVQFASNSYSKQNFDEHQWVMQIRQTLENNVEDDDNVHASIFDVPKSLRATNPNAYTPQLVAFGPYHFWRLGLQEMERYKVSSAKRIQNHNNNIDFSVIVNRLIMLEPRIRACYHKYLNINGETLAWMMAIDATFLLEVINTFVIKEGKVLTRVSSTISHLIDYTRRKSTHNAILRDILMLENQIPLFVLREMLGFKFSSLDLADKNFLTTLVEFYKNISPFKVVYDIQRIQPLGCEHIIDFFYNVIVPESGKTVDINSDPIDQEDKENGSACNYLSQMKECLGQFSMRLILALPCIFICNLPGFTILKTLLFSKKNPHENCDTWISNKDNECPLVEEIMIPSVVELSKCGVTFMPTNGDIMSISFDAKSKYFFLPTISLDLNSEVLLRNLVAYEALNVLGPLVFARYTELMNGIIDTKDDVKLLRERGIILNYLKSDEEVATLWNGMSKCLRLTKVSFLDEVIENVNKCYEGNWRVRMSKFCKAYATNSWHILIIMTAIVLLIFLILQAFFSMFHYYRTVGAKIRR